MAELKKVDLEAKEVGKEMIDDKLLDIKTNPQLIKDYIIAIRENKRQWSANTKVRSEANHSTQKPHAQKGTGKARQGFLGAPQYKGGAIVFGPRPKFDQHVRINKKERNQAVRFLIANKAKEQTMYVLKFDAFKEPKTKNVANFLKTLGLENSRVLFLKETAGKEDKDKMQDKYKNFAKSLKNLKKVQITGVDNVNAYDLAVAKDVIVLDSALDQLKTFLKGGK
ncbi:MAG: 50S ribosomal protein L4 [Chlamydiae bacterium]|nr:50S ribosomal protein L4 [Chlamydiota bacterium]